MVWVYIVLFWDVSKQGGGGEGGDRGKGGRGERERLILDLDDAQ